MARYAGRKGLVYVSTSGTGNAISVGQLSQWVLNMPTDKLPTDCFGDSNKHYVQSLKDVRGSLKGLWDDATDTLHAAADSTDGCKIYLYPSSDAIGKYFYGPAWLDISNVTADVKGTVDIAADFVANGDWGRM